MKLSGLPLLALLSVVSAQKLRESFDTLSIVAEELVKPAPEESCACQSDYDCQRPVCVMDPYTNIGTCGAGQTQPVASPTFAPIAQTDCCPDPKSVPTECEVDILISLLDFAISADHKLAAQWLRLSFHDAGTFKTDTNEGGANGCLMTDPNFVLEPENGFLDLPVNTLKAIKNSWEAHADTCIRVSAADIIQFAGLFASLRQVPPAGMDSSKTGTLKQFEWGRPDEQNCDVAWCGNLPGFSLGTSPGNIPLRCLNAGKEIKEKMMERNGFTAEESAALIGAHTIGLTRSTFGTGLAGPWVENGGDNATPDGPVFDNAFHSYLINEIVENTVPDFSQNIDSFDVIFPTWFRDLPLGLNHLDTDVVLAFPSQDASSHPDFHTFTDAFAADNNLFLNTFFLALEKMSKLGVTELLSKPSDCTKCDGSGEISIKELMVLVADLGTASADADDALNIKLQSEIFKQPREVDSIEVPKEEVLSVDEAVKEIEMVEVSESTLVGETIGKM